DGELLLNRILGRFTSVVAVMAVIATAVPARAGDGLTLSPALNAKLDRLYVTAYDETIQRHALAQSDGTTYVSTGDIEAEWLRDGAALHRALAARHGRSPYAARRRRAAGEVHPDRPVRQRLLAQLPRRR